MSNFKSQAKRKRELAKLDKRNAKDQKRAIRRAERSGTDVATAPIAGAPQSTTTHHRPSSSAPTAARKPQTLAEAAELWKSMKIAKPKSR